MITQEDKMKGLEDAISYTHELEILYELADRLLVESDRLSDQVNFTHALRSPVGRDRIIKKVGPDLDPYNGETILGVHRDLLEDIKFFTTGLSFILEEKYAYGL